MSGQTTLMSGRASLGDLHSGLGQTLVLITVVGIKVEFNSWHEMRTTNLPKIEHTYVSVYSAENGPIPTFGASQRRKKNVFEPIVHDFISYLLPLGMYVQNWEHLSQLLEKIQAHEVEKSLVLSRPFVHHFIIFLKICMLLFQKITVNMLNRVHLPYCPLK